MRKKVVTIGGSAGVTISPAELRELGLSVGDPVDVQVRAGVLELRPVNKHADKPMDELLEHINRFRTRS